MLLLASESAAVVCAEGLVIRTRFVDPGFSHIFPAGDTVTGLYAHSCFYIWYFSFLSYSILEALSLSLVLALFCC